MSDTPRTDANAESEPIDQSPFAPIREWVCAGFARELERELNQAKAELAKWEEDWLRQHKL